METAPEKPDFDLTEVHNLNFFLLQELDRICRKNNIRYFLDYGTLLGAVRHKDFIPWDDDVDVAVFREDYPALAEACRRELNPDMQFVEPHEYNGFFWDFIPRIEIINSQRNTPTAEDEMYNNLQNKICIDIFIIDKLPQNKFASILISVSLKIIYLLVLGHRARLDFRKYSPAIKIAVAIFAALGRSIPLQRLFNWRQKLCCCNISGNGILIKTNAIVEYMHHRFNPEWYAHSVPVIIRDKKFPAPCCADMVLKTFYGDYMTPPPESKRHPKHQK